MALSAAFVCLAFALLFVLTRRFLNLPLERQLDVFPDDAFYYLGPAWHTANGYGPTGDGITRTSGFHPLWMGLLIVFAKLSGANRLLLYDLAVVTGAFLHLITSVLVFDLGRRRVGYVLASFLALIYMLGAAALREAVGGIEASLLAMLLALFVLACDRLRAGTVKTVIQGVLLGLLFLARTDAALFVVSWLVIEFARRYWGERQPIGSALRSQALCGFVALLTIAPWLWLALREYGSIFQNSMLMKQLWRDSALKTQEASTLTYQMLKGWFGGVLVLPRGIRVLLTFLAGAGVVVWCARPAERRPVEAPLADAFSVALAAIALYVSLAGVYYATHFTFVRSWYFAPARLLVPLVAIWFVHVVVSRCNGRTALALTVAAVLLLGANSLTLARAAVRLKWAGLDASTSGAGNFLSLARVLASKTGRDDTCAAYSSGILSYFSNRRVINLDGLNNNDIYAVSRAGTMDKYLDQRGVRYLADYESIIQNGRLVGLLVDGDPAYVKRLREAHRIRMPQSEYGDLVLWRVTPGPE